MHLIGKYFPYDDSNQLKGIFNFYNHVIEKNMFSIYTYSHKNVESIDPIEITRRNNTNFIYWASADDYPNITFHFDYPILLTSYTIQNAPNESETIRHSYSEDFIVSGSNDNNTWIVIDEQKGIKFCNDTHGYCFSANIIPFIIKYPEYYSYIRLTNLKNSHSEDNNFIIMKSIEFFGEIKFKFVGTCQTIIFSNYHIFYLIMVFMH